MAKFQKGRAKTGGRKKGVKNKKTALAEAAIRRALGDNPDLEPLDALLLVMRDERVPLAARLDAAKAAAQYRHPRLAATEHIGNAGIHATIAGDDLDLL